jgi:hypothetical protein
MTTLHELTSMSVRQLSEVIAMSKLRPADLGQGEWLAVVQLLTARLITESGALSEADWLVCSSAVDYTLTTAEAGGFIDHNDYVIRLLNLSAALLQRISPKSDIPILNPQRMFALFIETVPMSAENARILSLDWRTLDISMIRQLRLAKNLVAPLLTVSRVLSDDDIADRLGVWDEVFPLLP